MLYSLYVIFVLLLILALPIFSFVFLKRNKKRLSDPELMIKYDSLYDSVIVENKYTIFYTSIFLMRRLVFTLSLLFINKYPML